MQPNQTPLLVVDHVSAVRATLCLQLGLSGFSTIYQADDEQSAWQILQEHEVRLIIGEIGNPTNGLALLERVRSHETFAPLPFILFTDTPQRDSAKKAMALKVSDFLIKPFTTKRLIERMERAMAMKPPSRIVLEATEEAAPAAQDNAAPATNASTSAQAAAGAPANTAASAPARVISPITTTVRSKTPSKPDHGTILIVDDTPENVEVLANLFKDRYKIKIATGGQRALAICTSDGPPDLVLLDVMMPDMDGFEVARRLREHHASSHTPIIFVTAMTESESRKMGLSLGAIDYVTKPIDPDLLNMRVSNLMTLVEHRKQLQIGFDQLRELEELREEVRMLRSGAPTAA